MADYQWPTDLVPFAMSFYLQPHTGGSESPFSRVTKVYGLSAPRWVCRMSFRGGDSVLRWGRRGAAAYGQRLDAFLAKLEGRRNRALIYDFRRPQMTAKRWIHTATNEAALAGATTMVVAGLSPGSVAALAGDYIGGDGRPHIVTDDAVVAGNGKATVSFKPPLKANVDAGAAVFGNPTGPFRLTEDNAGTNYSEVGSLVGFDLEFVEDL